MHKNSNYPKPSLLCKKMIIIAILSLILQQIICQKLCDELDFYAKFQVILKPFFGNYNFFKSKFLQSPEEVLNLPKKKLCRKIKTWFNCNYVFNFYKLKGFIFISYKIPGVSIIQSQKSITQKPLKIHQLCTNKLQN
jgi:hypothetical protein